MRPLAFLLIAMALLAAFLEHDRATGQRDQVIVGDEGGVAAVPASSIVCVPLEDYWLDEEPEPPISVA